MGRRPNLMKRSVEMSRIENPNNNMCNYKSVLSCDAFELNLDLLSQHEPFDIHGLGTISLISLGKAIYCLKKRFLK